jgi:hypothetical protein
LNQCTSGGYEDDVIHLHHARKAATRPSSYGIVASATDPENLPVNVKMDRVGDIHDIPAAAELFGGLAREYHEAIASLVNSQAAAAKP